MMHRLAMIASIALVGCAAMPAGAGDYFNLYPQIELPLALTVGREMLYPPCPGGS